MDGLTLADADCWSATLLSLLSDQLRPPLAHSDAHNFHHCGLQPITSTMRQVIPLACQSCQFSLCAACASSAPLPFLPLPLLGPTFARGDSALSRCSKASQSLAQQLRFATALRSSLVPTSWCQQEEATWADRHCGRTISVFGHSTEDDELRFTFD